MDLAFSVLVMVLSQFDHFNRTTYKTKSPNDIQKLFFGGKYVFDWFKAIFFRPVVS